MIAQTFARIAGPMLLVLLMAAAPAWGQAPPPLPKPDLDIRTNGSVHATLLLPDNSLVIAGRFSQVNGAPRNNVARLQPNGALDTDWVPDIDGIVYALAKDAAGFIYVGGTFTADGNDALKHLVRLSPTGVADPNWAPKPNSAVRALAVGGGASPAVFAGGSFTQIGGANRQRLARLAHANGAADQGWNVPADAAVHALLLVHAPPFANNELVVGGRFTQIGGQARMYLAHVNAGNGTVLNSAFTIDAIGTYEGTLPGVYALARRSTLGIVVGGVFRHAGGLTRHALFRYSLVSSGSTGFVDADWNPFPNQAGVDADAAVYALAVDDSTGAVHVGGSFLRIGAQDRTNLARLLPESASGAADPSWDARLSGGVVRALAVPAGAGVTFAGGDFTRARDQARIGMAALGPAGNPLDRVAQLAGEPGAVWAIARQADGGVVVGGSFHLVDGHLQRENILRLLPDGNIDPTWQPGFNSDVRALAIGEEDAVFAGGSFSRVDGVRRLRLAKLSATGILDPAWNPEVPNGHIYALAASPSGWVHAGGQFSQLRVGTDSLPRASLARLAGSGSGLPDPAWNPGVRQGGNPGLVLAMDLSPDGSTLVIGGHFDEVGGQGRVNIAKLSSGGEVDYQWFFPADGDVMTLRFDGNERLYAGGFFEQIGARPRRGIARLSMLGNGYADDDWEGGVDGLVLALSPSLDGGVFVGGAFEHIGGQPRRGLARLDDSGAADPAWNPDLLPGGLPFAMTGDGGDGVFVGGWGIDFPGASRNALARLPGSAERIFADGFES